MHSSCYVEHPGCRCWDVIRQLGAWLVARASTDCEVFPACQVRVPRFYQSYLFPPPSTPLPPPHPASSTSQWELPDLNRKLQISVGSAGPRPQPQAPDLSGHDLSGLAGPQLQAPDLIGQCRSSTASFTFQSHCLLTSGARGGGPGVFMSEKMWQNKCHTKTSDTFR